MADYSPSQRAIAKLIIAEGKRQHATNEEIVSALATGIVESRLSNPAGGEGTSAGWRQEISSYGSVAKRTNVRGAAMRYFKEAKKFRGHGLTSGELAAAVQRPRADLRGRYSDVAGEATGLLYSLGGAKGPPPDKAHLSLLEKAAMGPLGDAAVAIDKYNPVAQFGKSADFLAALGALVLTPEGWRRLLKVGIGGILLLWGINQLSKSIAGVNPGGAVATVAPVTRVAKAGKAAASGVAKGST